MNTEKYIRPKAICIFRRGDVILLAHDPDAFPFVPERVALIVDAKDYFRAFYEAALRARRSILVLAWDFNSQTRLHYDPVPKDGPPALLGDFLNYITRRRRGLHVHVLNWDYPMVFGADR